MEGRCERVGERTKELKLADRRGECLCQPSLGISSPLPARSSRRLSFGLMKRSIRALEFYCGIGL